MTDTNPDTRSAVTLLQTESTQNTTISYLDDNPSDEFVPPTESNHENLLDLETALVRAASQIDEIRDRNKEEISSEKLDKPIEETRVETSNEPNENESTLVKLVEGNASEKQASNEERENQPSTEDTNQSEDTEFSKEPLSEQLFFDSQDQPPFEDTEESKPVSLETTTPSQPLESKTDDLLAPALEPTAFSSSQSESIPSKFQLHELPQLNPKLDRLVDELALEYLIDRLAENLNFDQLLNDIVLFYAARLKNSLNQVRQEANLIK